MLVIMGLMSLAHTAARQSRSSVLVCHSFMKGLRVGRHTGAKGHAKQNMSMKINSEVWGVLQLQQASVKLLTVIISVGVLSLSSDTLLSSQHPLHAHRTVGNGGLT